MNQQEQIQAIYDKVTGGSDLDWSELSEQSGQKLHPDTLRKMGQGIKLAAEAGMLKFEPQDAPCSLQRMRNLRGEINEIYRAEARSEALREAVQDAARKLPPITIKEKDCIPRRNGENKTLVVAIGDFHYGAQWIVRGQRGEIINEYNPDIFEQRMRTLLAEIVGIIRREEITKVDIMLCGDSLDGMRPFEPDGSWAAKSKKEYILDEDGQRIVLPSGEYKSRKVDATDWNDQGKAEVWRQGWADAVNAALERQGHAERIDHRSYERQGIEQIPTVHLGVAAFQMEKRGIRTERGNINRQVQLDNKMLRQLRARINKLKSGLDELLTEAKSHPIPSISLADVLTGILEKPEEKTRRQKIADLKTFARAIAFVQANGIANLNGLRDKVVDMYSQQHGITDKLKKVERRLKTLDEHIRHADNYFKYRDIYRQYRKLPAKKQAAFYEAHRTELVLYEAAETYLRGVMNGRTTIPTATWKREAAQLNAERQTLYVEYTRLKEEVKDAEVIRRCVETVLHEPQVKRGRVQDVEL